MKYSRISANQSSTNSHTIAGLDTEDGDSSHNISLKIQIFPDRLSRQMILEPVSLRMPQIQLPKNPDPPDTRTLFPSSLPGSMEFLTASMSCLTILSNSRLPSHSMLSTRNCCPRKNACETDSGLASRDRGNQCLARFRSKRQMLYRP